MLNDNQVEVVVECIEEKMKKYKRPTAKLNKLYETIKRHSTMVAYVEDYSYEEFRDIFVKHFIKARGCEKRKFKIIESGYLDVKKRYPYDVISVEKVKTTKKTS